MDLFDLTPILAVPAVGKVIDLYRQAFLERDLRKTLFTVGSWAVGVALVFLVSESSAGATLPETWNWADFILVGVGLGATASYVHDFAEKGQDKVVVTGSAVEIEGSEPEPIA